TVRKLVVIVCLLCAKELSFGNPSDTQRKHDGHCSHRAHSDSPPCPSRGASGKELEASLSFSAWPCMSYVLCYSQAQGDTNGAEGTCQTNGYVCSKRWSHLCLLRQPLPQICLCFVRCGLPYS
ncbi:hypothetical protein V8C86DRAFT_2839321, partial [Haematococcus lacustris]